MNHVDLGAETLSVLQRIEGDSNPQASNLRLSPPDHVQD